jgi:hypothetical protein
MGGGDHFIAHTNIQCTKGYMQSFGATAHSNGVGYPVEGSEFLFELLYLSSQDVTTAVQNTLDGAIDFVPPG